MRKPNPGTEPPKAFAVEFGPAWQRWAKRRTDTELEELARRLAEITTAFGQPHRHSGLGVRRLTPRLFEFRIARAVRVVFAVVKPTTLQLAMCGGHDEVRVWLKGNS